MSDVAKKCIVLNANLKDVEYLNYNFAKSETRHGLWQVCVKDVAISFAEEINSIAQISSNLVIDQRLRNYTPETFNTVIATILIKGKIGEKKFQQIDQTWFEVNKSDSEVKLFFIDAESNERIKTNCKVFVSLLLKRIR